MDTGERKSSSRLGICIPAYRRPELLSRCLRAAIGAARPYQVPIFISDDSANDVNATVIAAASEDYPYIRWQRNEANLGIDRNILSAVSLCDAEYAWLMGEDDLIAPQGVAKVLDALAQGTPDFLFVNYSYVSNDYRFLLKERVVNISRNETLPPALFVERYAWAMGFIGACVLKRTSWNPEGQLIGTYYAHVGSILAGLARGSVTMIAEPLVMNRAENAQSFTWSKHAFEVTYGWYAMLKHIHQACGYFDLEEAITSSKALYKRSIPWLVSKRADNVYDRATYERFVRGSGDSPLHELLGFLVALCPRGICKTIKFIGRDVPRRLLRRPIVRDY